MVVPHKFWDSYPPEKLAEKRFKFEEACLFFHRSLDFCFVKSQWNCCQSQVGISADLIGILISNVRVTQSNL